MKTKILLDFVAAINAADVDKICTLMADDHLFIDAHDHKMTGRDHLKHAWIGYFALFPDYKIEINDIIEKDALICILGYASGTYKNIITDDNRNHWRVPAAWTAIIQDNQVKQWQVYADNIIVMDIVKRNQSQK
ncbi:MAG TPA: nuclear transport factor 2 family protein [Bacteroidales bacterium]|nr:nuclear transport factor 2 family protein [Bacteroidales bacterium]